MAFKRRVARGVGTALVLSALIVACSRGVIGPEGAPPARAQSGASSASPPLGPSSSPPPSSAPPPAPPPPATTISAWTDGPVVAELAKSCRYEPKDPPHEPGPLSCAYALYEQSCAVDPCHDDDQQKCKPKCEKGCNTCGATCADGCEACKKGCADDACRLACATTCAKCRQECLATKDQCSSGGCAEAYKTCTKEAQAEWKRAGCAPACKKHLRCAEGCGDDQACLGKCYGALLKVCPQRLSEMCRFNGFGPDGSRIE